MTIVDVIRWRNKSQGFVNFFPTRGAMALDRRMKQRHMNKGMHYIQKMDEKGEHEKRMTVARTITMG
jgi:hypothetical protein